MPTITLILLGVKDLMVIGLTFFIGVAKTSLCLSSCIAWHSCGSVCFFFNGVENSVFFVFLGVGECTCTMLLLSCDFGVLAIFICTAFVYFYLRIPKTSPFSLLRASILCTNFISILWSLLSFVKQYPHTYFDIPSLGEALLSITCVSWLKTQNDSLKITRLCFFGRSQLHMRYTSMGATIFVYEGMLQTLRLDQLVIAATNHRTECITEFS